MSKKTAKEFIEDVITTFPEIKGEVLDESWADITSLQIGCFRRFTQQSIDSNNKVLALKCFQFVDDNIDEVEFSIENSLAISWLGKLNFDKNPNMFNRLPVKLEKLYTHLLNEYSKPLDKKVADFLNQIAKGSD